MAIYRNIQMSFWTDSKIIDDFTPDERYFYLYLLTNPHTNLIGCYEISTKHIADETGYTKEKVDKLITKLSKDHKVIVYSKESKEMLLVNWHKYNWTQSEKLRKLLSKEIDGVKNVDFKAFLTDLYNGIDTVSIPHQYGMDTTVTVTVTDTVSVTDTDTDKSLTENSKGMKEEKHKRGNYGHVLLSDKDIEALTRNHGEADTQAAIDYLDAYIEEKNYKSKNHKSTIERWVFDAVKKKGHGDNRASNKVTPFNPTNFLLQQIKEAESGPTGNHENSFGDNSSVPESL